MYEREPNTLINRNNSEWLVQNCQGRPSLHLIVRELYPYIIASPAPTGSFIVSCFGFVLSLQNARLQLHVAAGKLRFEYPKMSRKVESGSELCTSVPVGEKRAI
jgi:hypothetical protein